MEVRQLRHFIEVVKRGSINTAAVALGITQPGVTRSIKKLEQQFGCPLLERSSRGVTVTTIGRKVYEHAIFVINESERVASEVNALRAGDLGHVTIGVGNNFSGHYLPGAVAQLLQDRKQATVTIREGYFEDLTPSLRSGELDFIFCIFPAYYHEPDLHYETLLEIKSSIFARVRHPLAQPPITRAMLSLAKWVFPEQTHVTRFKDRFFTKHKLPLPNTRVAAKSLTTIRELLLQTDLIALLPEYLVTEDVEAKRLIRLPFPQVVLTNRAGLITTRGRKLTGAALELTKCIRKACAEQN